MAMRKRRSEDGRASRKCFGQSEASERTFRCSEPRLRSDLGKSTRMPAKEMAIMEREIIRVEPLSTYLERWKAPTSAVTRHGDTIYVSGFPPFDPQTGEVVKASIERQTEIVLEQMKLCLETAGSSFGASLEVHRLLHLRREVRRRECGLCALLSQGPSRADFRERPGLAGPVRHRDRLCCRALEEQ